MAPHSPATDQINNLLWIGFAAAAIVVVAVNGALLFALRRYRGKRGGEPRQVIGGRRVQARAAGALTLFAAAVLVLAIVFTDKASQLPRTGPAGLQSARSKPLEIIATGQRWLWRYQYPNGAFSYYQLVVPVDTAVDLNLESTDVVHTWSVPDLAPKRDAVPGRSDHVVFLASRKGRYFGQAATLSGQAYAAMRTEVDVVSPSEYEAFVEGRKAEVQAAQDRVVKLLETGHILETGQVP